MGMLSGIFNNNDENKNKLPEFERKQKTVDEIIQESKTFKNPEPSDEGFEDEEPEAPKEEEIIDLGLVARMGASVDIRVLIENIFNSDIEEINGTIYLKINPKPKSIEGRMPGSPLVTVTIVTENEDDESDVSEELITAIVYDPTKPEELKTIISTALKETIKTVKDRVKEIEDKKEADEMLEEYIDNLDLDDFEK
jgi:hypothetical protein